MKMSKKSVERWNGDNTVDFTVQPTRILNSTWTKKIQGESGCCLKTLFLVHR